MAAGPTFPSWAYHQTQSAQIVASAAAFAALGAGWSYTPFATSSTIYGPSDSGLTNTDLRLQQILDEARVQTLMLAQGFLIADDPQTLLRPDVLANDSSVSS